MSTELVVKEEQESAVVLPPDLDLNVGGEENLRSGDVGMPPRLRISQQNRPIEGTQPGEIVNTLTGEKFGRVEFVPMVFLPTTRVMWPASFDADNQPLCVSDNGESPVLDQNRATNPLHGPCASCRYSQFDDAGTPPPCKKQRNFLVLCLPEYEPAILTMSSTAIAAAKQLTAISKMSGLRKSVVMATRKVEDTRGTWFVPVFVVGRKLEDGEILAAVEFRDDLKNLIITADVVQENGMEQHAEAADESQAPVYYDEEEEIPF